MRVVRCIRAGVVSFAVAALAVGCSSTPVQTSPSSSSPGSSEPTVSATELAAPDYADKENWLALPGTTDKPVDVVYYYPSTYTGTSDLGDVATIDDAGMRAGAKNVFAWQATAYETVGNIYAPYYRQADAQDNIQGGDFSQWERTAEGVPAADANAAFAYYIEHFNQGRPFILAGHSQGSKMVLTVLSDYLKTHPDVYQRMIAAYAIGIPVTEDYLAANPHLKFATGASDTGAIISYNTEAPTIEGVNPVVQPGMRVINPITWTTDETPASATQNLGSIRVEPGGGGVLVLGPDGEPEVVENLADATVNKSRGVVVCSTAPVDTWAPGNALFPRGTFHGQDYSFYYYNIRANAAERVSAFLAAQ